MLDKIKAAMNGEQEQSSNLLKQVDEAMTLSWKQRLIGFGCCIATGFLMCMVSIPMLWTLNITGFAIFYSLGSVTAILSTIFLMGPVKQFQRMFEQHRAIATTIYLLAIIATLVLAFKLNNAGVCLVMIVVQFCALIWYCLTWIPGGTSAVKAMIVGSG